MASDGLVITRKTVKRKPAAKVCSVRIRKDLVDTVDELAERTGYKRSTLVMLMLDYALEHYHFEDKAAE